MLLVLDVLSFGLGRKGWSRFASTFLLFYAQVIGTEFLLGLFFGLYSYSLVALNVILTSGLAFFLQRRFGTDIVDRYLASWRKTFVAVKQTVRQDPLFAVLCAITLLLLCWIVFLGIIFPSADFDGNSYHLTFIGNLIQTHTFYDAPSSSVWVMGYPKGGEFIQAWSVLITHSDTFTDLTQVPFMFLAVYALYQISTELGANKRHARFAALLFAALPIVSNQLKTAYVDVMLCAVFLAGLAFVIQKKYRKLDLLLLGIIFSLIISVKSTGIFFVVALLPFLAYYLYTAHGRAAKQYLRPLGLLVGPLVFGVYWYIKDVIAYGSPLYPYGIQVAGHTIFHGRSYQAASETALQAYSLPHSYFGRIWYTWTEQKDWFGCMYNYDSLYSGFGPLWLIVLLPAFLVSLYLAIKTRNKRYLLVSLMLVMLYVIYPQNFYTRYTLFITALGIIGLGLVLSSISVVVSRAVKVLSIALALFVIGTNFTFCNYPPGAVKDQLKSVTAGSQRGVVYANFPGEAFVYIENHVKPGQTVVYSSSPYFIYPLWTPNFSDKVIFIPAKSNADWYSTVRHKHANYVFATIGSKEDNWAKSDHMKQLYKDSMYEIFQVN